MLTIESHMDGKIEVTSKSLEPLKKSHNMIQWSRFNPPTIIISHSSCVCMRMHVCVAIER